MNPNDPNDPYAWQRPNPTPPTPNAASTPNQPPYPTQPGQELPSLPNQPTGNAEYPTTAQPVDDGKPSFAAGQPGTTGHNPYEFIFNQNTQPKKSALGGDRFLKKIIVSTLIVVVLVVIGGFVAQAFLPKDSAKDQYISLAQEQNELMRVAANGTQATSEPVRGFTANAALSIKSDQTKLLKYLASRNIALKPKELTLKQNPKTDQLLAAATTTNTFDSALRQELATELQTYSAHLTTTYKSIASPSGKALLKDSYDSTQLLIKQSGAVTQ